MSSILNILNQLPASVSPDDAVKAVNPLMGWICLGALTRKQHEALYKKRMCIGSFMESGTFNVVHGPTHNWDFWFAYKDCIDQWYNNYWICLPEYFETAPLPEHKS